MNPEQALERYIADHQVDGIAYTRHDSGLYFTDDDNSLYTGLMLGAMAYRYAASPSPDKLEAVRMCLRGVSLLTRATGEPGVLVRRAMPSSMAHQFGVYETLAPGNFWIGKPLEESADYIYQLKTTKDQATGILFGLACCRKLLWGVDPQINDSVSQIIHDMYRAIESRDWSLRDHKGRTHGTSAHVLDAGLKLLLQSLAYSVGAPIEKPSNSWFTYVDMMTMHYNTIFQNAYSHGLNAANQHALVLLSDFHRSDLGVVRWGERINALVHPECNPFWELLLTGKLSPIGEFRLEESGEEPYAKFFKWNKYTKELRQRDDTSGPMIDYMLVSYMRDYLS